MCELATRVVDDFGALVSISGGTEEPVARTTPTRFEQFEFLFEHGCVTVSTAPEDDTVRLMDERMTLPHVVLLTKSEPWSAAVGSGVLCAWILENHKGYRDGFQIEFGRSSGYLSVQLMCEASGLTAASVLPLPGQFLEA